MTAAPPIPAPPRGVGLRIALLISLALAPLGLLAVSQNRNIARQAEETALVAVQTATAQLGAAEGRELREAQSLVQMLAEAVAPHIADDAACRGLMEAARRVEPAATLFSFTPLSGRMTCASDGQTHDFAGNATFAQLTAAPEPRTIFSASGVLSGTAVVNLSHPVLDGAGAFVGIVSVSLPHDPGADASALAVVNPGEEPVVLATFDMAGRILSSSSPLDETALRLPRGSDLSQIAAAGPQAFVAVSNGGVSRLYAVVRVNDQVNLLGVWPNPAAGRLIAPTVAAFIYPALMWLAGLGAALIAAELLVTRHLRQLARAMRAFANGDRRRVDLRLPGPPAEIAQLAAVYTEMTETILRDEADLENLVHQREALMRELHHRTGNSLQLIASVIRMHMREDPDPEMFAILESLHDRVMSLSSVHFGLYRMAGRPNVAIDQLLEEVMAKIATIHERFGRKRAIAAAIPGHMLSAQQAVPLALLLSEILAAFLSTPEEDGPALRVEYAQDAERSCRLSVTGPAAAAGALTGQGDSLPETVTGRLIRAFAAQIGAEMTFETHERDLTVAVRFHGQLVSEGAPTHDPAPAERTHTAAPARAFPRRSPA